MRELPMLYSTPMVQALLDGRKKQTRRIVKGIPAAAENNPELLQILISGKHAQHGSKLPPCKKGDLIWVRETFFQVASQYSIGDSGDDFALSYRRKYHFLTEGSPVVEDLNDWNRPIGWTSDKKGAFIPFSGNMFWHKRPSIFMPKDAARIWLRVTEVSVERLNDISEADAVAEGVQPNCSGDLNNCPSSECKNEGCQCSGEWFHYTHSFDGFPAYSAVESFESLWQSINGPDSWKLNPWVWVIKFEVVSTTGRKGVKDGN